MIGVMGFENRKGNAKTALVTRLCAKSCVRASNNSANSQLYKYSMFLLEYQLKAFVETRHLFWVSICNTSFRLL